MVRRPQKHDPEQLRTGIINHLETIRPKLQTGTLRERVQALVPAFIAMRDLGAIQMPSEKGVNEAARARILRYLRIHVGQVIAGHELMVISGIGDYPRRIRELRVEHGWSVISGVTAKEMQEGETEDQLTVGFPQMKTDEYMLVEDRQDSAAASRWKVANEIRKSSSGVKEKILRYLRANVAHPVTGEELRYVANKSTEWARRTRELRTEEGWPVATRFSGRPDLPMGLYVLEDDRQSPPHDRHINEKTRRGVLGRDQYTCRDCGWNHVAANPSDIRFLELHHIVHHARGGKNIEENLRTLCNICHDERHRHENSANT